MQVGKIDNTAIAASMRIGNTALQAKRGTNNNALANVIPDKLKTGAQNSTNSTDDAKKLSKDMKAKLREMQDDMRLDLSPEDMKEARRLLRLMRGLTNSHMNASQRFANELEPIATEKGKLDNIIAGKEKADFEDMTI